MGLAKFLVASLTCGSLLPSPAAGQEGQPPIFHAESRLVTVDVAVEEAGGAPLLGLTQDDFIVLDNGKTQTLRFFDRREQGAVAIDPREPLPPAALRFTNVADYARPASFNVFLLDTLNSSATDQQNARLQLLRVLPTLPQGDPIAVVVLDTNLTILQGFTSDHKTVADAIGLFTPRESALLITDKDQQQADARTQALEAGRPARARGDDDAMLRFGVSQQSYFAREKATMSELRAAATLNTVRLLATSLAQLPRRKNIFWLSSAFPLSLTPDVAGENPFNSRNYSTALETTAALLATARIAIYPVDLRGLTTTGQALETPGRLEFKDLQFRQLTELWSSHDTMSRIADETGGRAFYGSNDFGGMLKTALARSGSYYTLSYNHNRWDGQYHHIEVKLRNRNAKLIYRKGYYAAKQSAKSLPPDPDPLAIGLYPDIDRNKIGVAVTVEVPSKADDVAILNYAVSARDLVAIGDEKTRTIELNLVAMAWNAQGQETGSNAESMKILLNGDEYTHALANGVRFQRRMLLAPGIYRVSTAVIDRISRRSGVVRFSLSIGEHSGERQPGALSK